MDPVIMSAIITAISSAFVAIISTRPSKNNTAPTLSEIRYQQLCLLFEPIEKMMVTVNTEDSDAIKTTVLDIRNLLIENHKLVPPFLYREVLELSKLPILFSNDLENLRAMNASLYNWHCKNLGYPYIAKKIVRKYAPMYNRYIMLRSMAYRAAPILSLLNTFLTFIFSFIFDLTTASFLLLLLPSFILLVITVIFIAQTDK